MYRVDDDEPLDSESHSAAYGDRRCAYYRHVMVLKDEDKSQKFEVIQAEKVQLPDELAMLLSVHGYENEVWCLTFKPPLYWGCPFESDMPSPDTENMQNMLLLNRQRDGWVELGQPYGDGERWIDFLCSTDIDCFNIGSPSYYAGPTQEMFQAVGCSIWQPEGDHSDQP